MYTNKARMTGLSGIDTESMVQQLMKAESMKLTKLKQNKDLLVWKQEAYRTVSSTISTFRSTFFDYAKNTSTNMLSAANFKSLSATVSFGDKDSKAISVKASSDAKSGSHNLKVSTIAKADLFKSGEIAQTVTGDTAVSYSTLSAGDTLKVNVDGAVKEITFTAEDVGSVNSNSSFETMLNKKLTASFGTKLTAQVDGTGVLTLTAGKGHTAKILESTNEANSSLAKLGLKAGSTTNIDTSKSMSELFGITGSINFEINGVDFSDKNFDGNVSLKTILDTINNSSAGVKMSYDSFSSTFSMESKSTGAKNAIEFKDLSTNGFFENAMRFGANNTVATRVVEATDAVFELNGIATSRETNNFTISGLTINLTADAEPKKVDENGDPIAWVPNEFKINLATDTTATKEMIVKFVTEYNNMIDLFNKQTDTARPKSSSYSYYQPLSDEEKEAMSEKQIETWEEKAKTGMLYRDSIVRDINSQLRNMLYTPVELEDGTKISLFEIGITTSSKLSDAGKLVIDDAVLEKALTENIDKVAGLFTKRSDITQGSKDRTGRLKTEGMSDRINDILFWATSTKGALYEKSGAPNSSSTQYDMYDKIKDQETRISDMLTYLSNKETYYYNMFSKLEVAMNQSNSQMSSLQSMLGM